MRQLTILETLIILLILTVISPILGALGFLIVAMAQV